MPKVSVIITVYNGERYIRESLESILNQSFKDIEVICVDDASTDGTWQILQKYKERIVLWKNKQNLTAGESRNIGLRMAKGKYVIFLDADDIFEKDMLEIAYKKAEQSDADICIFKENQFKERIEDAFGYPYTEMILKTLGEREFFSPLDVRKIIFNLWNGWAWDKLFRRGFILEKELRFQNIRTSNDGFFVHAALMSAKRISFVNTVLVHHRTGNCGSLSNTRNKAWQSCLFYLRELNLFLDKKLLREAYGQGFLNWSAEFLYWNYQTLEVTDSNQLYEEMKKFMTEDLKLDTYDHSFFYNQFFYKFVQKMSNGNIEEIPITENRKFACIYRENKPKMKTLYSYLKKRRYRIALWGAGIRGREFMKVYGSEWDMIMCVFDRKAVELKHNFTVGVCQYNKYNIENINMILVMNSANLLEIKEELKSDEQDIALFDLTSYIYLPLEIEECIVKC